MAKLLVLVGLPASGKTTIALALESAGWVRVNKDDIRTRLETERGWVWSREGEARVVSIRDEYIMEGLAAGRNVVSDDTNLAKKHIKRLRDIAHQFKAEVEVKRVDVPLMTCLERNRARSRKARVPDAAIEGMFRDLIQPDQSLWPLSAPTPTPDQVSKVEWVKGLPTAIICDLDGTISLFGPGLNDRSPYDAAKSDLDTPNPPIARLIGNYAALGFTIIYLSGREDRFRPQTEKFLATHHLPKPTRLFMRPTGDFRKDAIVKRELFDSHVRGVFNVDFVLDDRDQVVKMRRGLGLTCLQVAEGNF